MEFPLILFLLMALVAVISAVAMLVSRNPVYSAIFLILNFSIIAIFYLQLGAPFLSMAQITVYAGAIMVLFLFVIMLLGGESEHRVSSSRWQAPLAVLLALILIGEGVYFFIAGFSGFSDIEIISLENFGSPTMVGSILFNEYLLPFEITSILLLVAMVGAIFLTKSEKR